MKARLQPSGCQLDLGAVYGSAEGHERESYTIRAFFSPYSKLTQRETRTDARSVPCLGGVGVWGCGVVEGNGQIYLEGKKNNIVAATEDDGWRQSQIQAKRKVKISEEKENMNRNGNNILHKVRSYTDKNQLFDNVYYVG